MLPIKNAAFDKPDKRDLKLSEIAGLARTIEVPDEILPNYKTIVLDQGNTMRCTMYSVSHAVNELNYSEARQIGVDIPKTLNGIDYLSDAIKNYGYSERDGGYIQNAIKLYKDKGEFEGYAVVKGKDAIKMAIASGRKVCTGSNTIDWNKTQNYAVRGIGYGHAFSGLYYNREGLIIKNSLGIDKHDRGYFIVRWEDLDLLFTCYALLDKSDAPALWSHRAVNEKLTTQSFEEFRPFDLVTRGEAAAFISRKFNVSTTLLFNGAFINNSVTLYEISVMLARAKGIKEPSKGISDGFCTRWNIIKLICS